MSKIVAKVIGKTAYTSRNDQDCNYADNYYGDQTCTRCNAPKK